MSEATKAAQEEKLDEFKASIRDRFQAGIMVGIIIGMFYSLDVEVIKQILADYDGGEYKSELEALLRCREEVIKRPPVR